MGIREILFIVLVVLIVLAAFGAFVASDARVTASDSAAPWNDPPAEDDAGGDADEGLQWPELDEYYVLCCKV